MKKAALLLALLLLAPTANSLRGYGIQLDPRLFLVNFQGTSMCPALRPGDTLIAVKAPWENLKVGDVILHYSPIDLSRPLIAHRMVERLPDGRIRTKGDNNPLPDRYYLDNQWYVGKVVAVLFTSSSTWGEDNCG